MNDELVYEVCSKRYDHQNNVGGLHTGIFVRAKHHGAWGTYDIAVLTKESFLEFMGKDINMMEKTLIHILGFNEEF